MWRGKATFHGRFAVHTDGTGVVRFLQLGGSFRVHGDGALAAPTPTRLETAP